MEDVLFIFDADKEAFRVKLRDLRRNNKVTFIGAPVPFDGGLILYYTLLP
jgi:hypothetical protein